VRAVLYEGGHVHADRAAQDCTALTGMKKAAVALAPANSPSSCIGCSPKLATKRHLIESFPLQSVKTMGIVQVAAFAPTAAYGE
jgi:hypothetical protein